MVYVIHNDTVIAHHGVLGMKWGVRRYQPYSVVPRGSGEVGNDSIARRVNKQRRRINTMYNRSNMWTNRKIAKLEKKGKINKANVMKEMVKRNEEARKDKMEMLDSIKTKKDLRKTKIQDIVDYMFGGQDWMKDNSANMTSFFTRLNEYGNQRGTRWASNFTFEKTLSRMSPSEGYEYLRRKHLISKHSGGSSNITVNYAYN